MKINIEFDEDELTRLIINKLEDILNVTLTPEDIKIEVKSTQNYRSEWEKAKFRARVIKGGEINDPLK